jgi:hypothetical protein
MATTLTSGCGKESAPQFENGSAPEPWQRPAIDLSATSLTATDSAVEPGVDPRTGLIVAAGFEEVSSTCTVCHSAKLITQNRGTRSDWEEALRWMQRYHNLWNLDPALRDRILDYLATNYGVDVSAAYQRRRPLPAHLLPPSRAEWEARASTPLEAQGKATR